MGPHRSGRERWSGGASDQAKFTSSLLFQGAHSITAAYDSDANFNPSTSSAASETVKLRSGTTGVALSPAMVVVGQASTVTATVTDSGTNPPGTADKFAATGAPATGTTGSTSTLFGDGLVLVAGGKNSSGTAVQNAYIYNASAGTFTATGNLNTARTGATATLLPNGKILIAGGSSDGTAANALNSAELFDPTGNSGAGTFTPTSSAMNAKRYGATATLLANGKVLLAGGQNSGLLASAELYDSAADGFTATGGLTTARYCATATLLGNGQVLIAGGTGTGPSVLASAELFDPTGNSNVGTFSLDRQSRHSAYGRHGHAAVER